MTPLFRKFLGLHWILFVALLAMIVMGVFSIYAAVHFREEPGISQQWNTQIRWALIGLVLFFTASLIDYKWIRWACLPLYIAGNGLLVLQGIKGEEVAGQTLSLRLGGVSFQAAQFAVASTILLLAFILGEAHKLVPWLRHYLVRFVVAGMVFTVPFLLMLQQKDLGTAMVMIPIMGAMLLVGNIPFRCLITVLLAGLIVAPPVFVFKLKPYQQDRIKVPLDMLMNKPVDKMGAGWNLVNIQTGVGSAGWEGKGLNPAAMPQTPKSMLQLGLTSPNTAHTDFIFASASETFGFRGGAAIILGFFFILIMCLTIAFFSRDQLGKLLVVGVVGQIFAHVFEHIGMNIGLTPITGIPLPLVSYGGTFLLINMCLFGLVQSVWVHRAIPVEETGKKPRHPAARPHRAPAYV